MSRDSILDAIRMERERQQALFGEKDADVSPLDFQWLAICAEQVGKASSTLRYLRSGCAHDPIMCNAYEVELLKLAASALQAIEEFERHLVNL